MNQEVNVAPGTEHICRGYKLCENKTMDVKDKDCKECIEDVDEAIKKSIEDITNDFIP